jgi:hypothetical protein
VASNVAWLLQDSSWIPTASAAVRSLSSSPPFSRPAPETKLGPSEVRHHGDGKVTVGGEEVDDPDEYRGDPIPGGPTDPEAAELPGERRKREKRERIDDGD